MSTRPTPAHRTPVRSEPPTQPTTPPAIFESVAYVALALVLIFFGSLAWVVGGKYTIDGWLGWLAGIRTWLGMDGDMPAPRGWQLVGLIGGVGLAYSLVELLVWRASARRRALFWVGWIPIVLTDLGSTYSGLRAPASTDPLVLRQVAASWPLASGVTVVLTFLPEWMIVGGLLILFGALRTVLRRVFRR